MEIQVIQLDGKAFLKIKGSIDELGAVKMNNKLRSMELTGVQELIIDLENVDYVCNSGVSKLLDLYYSMSPSGGKIQLKNLQTKVYEYFNVLKLNSVFNISQ